jgi:hypothetical protein
MTNFEFLSSIPEYALFSGAAIEAEKVCSTSPAMCNVINFCKIKWLIIAVILIIEMQFYSFVYQ